MHKIYQEKLQGFRSLTFGIYPQLLYHIHIMPKKTTVQRKQDKRLTILLVQQMLTLATSGFGLVAALAWNSLVQELVNNYIKKFLPNGSGPWSLFIYALVVTALAVFITYQLSKILRRLGAESD